MLMLRRGNFSMPSLKHAGVFYAVLHVWHCMVLDLLSTRDEYLDVALDLLCAR